MAGPLAQHCVNSRPEGIQQVKGYESLNRPRKTAAVNPIGAPSVQVMLTKSQGNSLRG